MNVTRALVFFTLLLGSPSFALPTPWHTRVEVSGAGTKFEEARQHGRANMARERAAVAEECKASGGYLYPKIRTTGRCVDNGLGKANCEYVEHLSCFDSSEQIPMFSFPGWTESLEVSRRAPSREAAFKKAEKELDAQGLLLEKMCKEANGKWWPINDEGGWWTEPIPGVAEAYLKTSAGNCVFDFPKSEQELE